MGHGMKKHRSLDYDGLDGVLHVAETRKSGSAWRPSYGVVAVVLVGAVGAFLSISSMQQPVAPVVNEQRAANDTSLAKPAESISPPIPAAIPTPEAVPAPIENEPMAEAATEKEQAAIPLPPAAVNQTTIQAQVYFKLDASKPNLSDKNQIKTLVEAAKNCPDLIQLTGHTCNLGAPNLNKTLGLTRATNVKKWLVTKGIAAEKIRIASEGMDKPAASNQTPQGQSLNRRVELICQTH